MHVCFGGQLSGKSTIIERHKNQASIRLISFGDYLPNIVSALNEYRNGRRFNDTYTFVPHMQTLVKSLSEINETHALVILKSDLIDALHTCSILPTGMLLIVCREVDRALIPLRLIRSLAIKFYDFPQPENSPDLSDQYQRSFQDCVEKLPEFLDRHLRVLKQKSAKAILH